MPEAFTFWRGLVRRLRGSQQGLARTLSGLGSEFWEFVVDSLPSRRRQRWGDIDFDCDYRVDTTAARLNAYTRLLGAIAGGPYQPTEPALFHEMLNALPIDFREFTFIDLGSGKGRALLMAADYPFCRIVGVELLPELHRIAEHNIRRYRGPQQKCFAIESCCDDALQFELPPVPIVLYIFNPFPESGMAKLIDRLRDSIARNPRPVYVVYHHPILEQVLSRSALLRKITGTHQFAIYSNVTAT